ncbi:MAG: universal stress protein [Gemmatimonadales bacterium]
MFTRLLVGLDGSPQADIALEQAVILGERFRSTLMVVHVRERRDSDADLLTRAAERVTAAGLAMETLPDTGEPSEVLVRLAAGADLVCIGRQGRKRTAALGPTARTVIKRAGKCTLVCGGSPSPMRRVAVAYDGGPTSQRALDLGLRYSAVAGSELDVIHAGDPAAGATVVAQAEMALSMNPVVYRTHVRAGEPGVVVAAVIRESRCDALFVGAHVEAGRDPDVSHAEAILVETDIPVMIQP